MTRDASGVFRASMLAKLSKRTFHYILSPDARLPSTIDQSHVARTGVGFRTFTPPSLLSFIIFSFLFAWVKFLMFFLQVKNEKQIV